MIYKRKYGQFFLIDKKIINFIIKNINPKYYQNIVEIGPGLGSITIPIIKYLNSLTLIEIDNFLSNKLLNLLDRNKIILYNEDARFINYNKILRFNSDKIKIFGNLPYNNSMQILINCIKYNNIIDNAFFMLQKELSDKIINKNLCKFSIFIKCFFDIKLIYKCIYPNSFYPISKVNSSIIKIVPKKNNIFVLNNIFFLNKILNILFKNKRKIIKNKLINLFSIKNINLLNNLNFINFNSRAQDISINQYIKLLFFYIKYELKY